MVEAHSWVWLSYLAVILPAIVWIDIRRRIIPDSLTLLVAAGGFLHLAQEGWPAFIAGVEAVVAVGAGLLCVKLCFKRLRGHEGLGLGDVKLLAASALWVGAFGISWMILVASVSGLVTFLVIRMLNPSLDRTARLPFGPHIALGLFIVVLLQPVI